MLKKVYLSFLNLLESPMKEEFFQSTQKYFQLLGVNLKQAPHKYPLNLRNVRTLFAFGVGNIACVCYIVTSAKTFEDFITSFYVLSSMLICFSTFSIVLWRMDRMERLFTEINRKIQERKPTKRSSFFITLLAS